MLRYASFWKMKKMISTNKNAVLAEKFNFLVVDDHDFMRNLVVETLRLAGAGNIVKASNGEEAIAVLMKVRKVDFIITDFNMPKMNGLELLKTIRTSETALPNDVPVIMLSGFEDEDLLSSALLLDASGFIFKPVSKIDLVERLNTLFMRENSIKSADEYTTIPIPAIDGEFEKTGSTILMRMVPRVSREIKEQGISYALDEVPENSLVVADVVTANGITLLHEGNRMNANLIEFLRETESITKVSEVVVVVDLE